MDSGPSGARRGLLHLKYLKAIISHPQKDSSNLACMLYADQPKEAVFQSFFPENKDFVIVKSLAKSTKFFLLGIFQLYGTWHCEGFMR